MAKDAKGNKITLAGGNKAHLVNPLGVTKRFKAVCVNDGKVLSDDWRNTKAEAIADASAHIALGHFIDFNVRVG